MTRKLGDIFGTEQLELPDPDPTPIVEPTVPAPTPPRALGCWVACPACSWSLVDLFDADPSCHRCHAHFARRAPQLLGGAPEPSTPETVTLSRTVTASKQKPAKSLDLFERRRQDK